MLQLGLIAFAAPWLLGALAILPAVWWLLRLTPPRPRQVVFPAIRLLRDLVAREETPARTPWWLLALRVLAVALIVVGLADPVLHPASMPAGGGPLVLAVDDGWAAARGWAERQSLLSDLLLRAERGERPVVVLTTAPVVAPGAPADAPAPLAAGPMRAAEARRLAQALEPHPWPADRAAALAAFKALGLSGPLSAVWLADGLEDAGAGALAREFQRLGGDVEVVTDPPDRLPDLVLPPVAAADALTVRLARPAPGPRRTAEIRLTAGDGRLLAREPATFADAATTAEARFDLPLELRNQAVRLSLDGQATAAAVVLLDERWRRRPVGLVAGAAAEPQPLLGDLYYVERALAPFAEVRRGTVAELIKGDLSVLILADAAALSTDEAAALTEWVGRGGLLVRFAGPRLAHAPDALLPVRLRAGDRTLGGALSWTQPARLAPFDPAGPFAGLSVPADVTVSRQVLAEPSLDTTDRTWVRLADGTPLVTADRRGRGSLVLIHTTANPDWSNLALSGLFVDMLRRLVALSAGVAAEGRSGALAPLDVLDGLGRSGEPPPTAQPIPAAAFAETRAGPRHPPGFYGTADARRALNLTAGIDRPEPLRPASGVRRTGYARTPERDLKPVLLLAALLLLLADTAAALALRGLAPTITVPPGSAACRRRGWRDSPYS